MKRNIYSLSLISVAVILLFGAHPSGASQYEQAPPASILSPVDSPSAANLSFGRHFPLPESLVPNVDFWISIYSKYDTSQWVIHDKENLGIVYEVVDAGKLFPGENLNSRKVERYMEKRKKHIAQLLKKIHKNKGVAVNPEEAAIANALPDRLNSYSQFLKYYRGVRAQRGLSDRFREGIERSGQFLARMRKVFRQHGLPEELCALPHVESSFYYKAYSKAGAAGIWQFTRGTGKSYMRIDYLVDERRDPMFSTHSAASLLKKNYDTLGSWPLAITAYNHGLNGMKRSVAKHGSSLENILEHYKSGYFGFASKNFYAEFLAALEVSRNYMAYFGPVDLHEQVMYDEIAYGRYIHVSDLATATSLPIETLKTLNPSLSEVVWDGKARIPKNFKLKVPEGMGSFALLSLDKVPSSLTSGTGDIFHKVRKGETISRIAVHYGVSESTLLSANNINPRALRIGSKILVPSPTKNSYTGKKKKASSKTVAKVAKPAMDNTIDPPQKLSPAVMAAAVPTPANQPGGAQMAMASDSTEESNRDFLVNPPSPSPVEQSNPEPIETPELKVVAQVLGRDLHLNPRLYFFRSIENGVGYIIAAPEESIGLYAEWARASVWEIRKLNGGRRHLQAGQKVMIPLSNVSSEEFEIKRMNHYKSMMASFLENHDVEDEKQVVVKKGKSIWTLCVQEHNTPLWLVMLYNPGKEIRKLLPGDTLTLPMFSRK
ncbi:MAG: transglycosylase SLT domain-containing protein [Nitrospinota bacterium]|nr:transglycosylase SLT domain-containing protein [Nitrospinota bacterium]